MLRSDPFSIFALSGTGINGRASGSSGIKKVEEKIQQTLSQSTVDESIISPDDAVGKVLGKEHSERIGDASENSRSDNR
uniref:Uncharacterized protein n=1 Tax=Solanum tuberosum TaxID=4113 RepID=M1BC81_SOLTU